MDAVDIAAERTPLDMNVGASSIGRLRTVRDRLNDPERRLPEQDVWVSAPDEPRRRIVIDLAAIAAVTTITIFFVFRLWEAHLRVPFGYGTDGLQYARDAKVLVQTGWIQSTERLGAPFGQEMYDFALSGDNGNYALMRLIGLVTGADWALMLNTFFFLGFYTAAAASYLSMRWLRCGRTSAIVCSLVFAFAPYHLARGSYHIMLASYWVAPVAVLLAVRAATGRPLIDRDLVPGERSRTAHHLARTVPWIVLCMACASFGSYYCIFAMITICLASTLMAASRRSWRPLVTAGTYCLTIAGTFAFHILPNLLYRLQHGVNDQVAERLPIELDIYGLRLIQMITPAPGHFIAPLRSISDELMAGYDSEPTQFLGLLGATGLLMMLGWIAVRAVRRRGADEIPDVRELLAVLTVAWLLIAMTGGLNWIGVVVGFMQLRAWDRVSILLMFVVLVWLSLTVSPLVRRWVDSDRARARWALVAASLVLIFALVDQSSSSFAPNTNVNSSAYESDKNFFGRVEAGLPRRAMVYQLPYRRYPEELPTYGSGDYDLFRPFLNTDELRFSYGGMKGREAEWQAKLTNLPTRDLVRDVIAVGYEAFVIDRAGYPDQGVAIEEEIEAVIGRAPMVSPDGRWTFFDLTGLATEFGTPEELALRRTALLEAAP